MQKELSFGFVPCDKKKKKFSKVLFWSYAVLLLTIQVFNCFYNTLWGDEACTVVYSADFLPNLIEWTASDVHPPLYYIGLKILIKLLGTDYFILSLSSLVPFVIIILIARFYIKEEFSYISAFLLITFWGLMPQSVYNLAEIRMYSWGALVLTVALLFVYDILKVNRISTWVALTIVSVIGTYIHYFALVHLFFIYVFLLVYFLLYRRKEVMNVLLSGLTIILAYIPWIRVFMRQTIRIGKNGWWMSNYEIPTFQKCTNDLLSGTSTSLFFSVFIVLFVYSVLTAKRILFFDKKDNGVRLVVDYNRKSTKLEDKKIVIVYCGIVSILGTFILGLTFSNLIKPTYVYRYVYFAAVIFWLIFSIVVGYKDDHIYELGGLLLIFVLIFTCLPSAILSVRDNKNIFKYTNGVVEYIKNNVSEEDIIISDTSEPMIRYYFDGNKTLHSKEPLDRVLPSTEGKTIYAIVQRELTKEEIGDKDVEQVSQGKFTTKYDVHVYKIMNR